MTTETASALMLAQRFVRSTRKKQLKIMRAVRPTDDMSALCIAAGLYPDYNCIRFWIADNCPHVIAFRRANCPESFNRVVPGVYL